MKYELTIFGSPFCHYCESLKKRLDGLNIIYFDFNVDLNREEWEKIVSFLGIDILPTIYLKDVETNTTNFYLPGRDYKKEDEIIEILINRLKI